MPYTIMKGLLWFALALLLGGVVAWLLASLRYRRLRSVHSRSESGQDDRDELARLRGRVANLESAVADRDRLRDELARSQAELEGARNSLRRAGLLVEDSASDAPEAVLGLGELAADEMLQPDSGRDEAPSAVIADEPSASRGESSNQEEPQVGEGEVVATPAPAEFDLEAGEVVLGRTLSPDDLKVIEGIGPKIEALCNGIGVLSWSDLANIEVSLLKTMLNDAGSRFQIHDPSTWPQQGALLAQGRWEDFAALSDELKGGRASS